METENCSQDIRAWQNSESQFSMCQEEGFSDAIVYRLVGKNLQKPHDSCIVSGRETEGLMRRRTRSRPQFGGLSTECVPFIVAATLFILRSEWASLAKLFSRSMTT